MFKYLLIIGTTATVGFIAWKTYNEVKGSPPHSPTVHKEVVREIALEVKDENPEATKAVVKETTSTNSTIKNPELHDAFAKILNKEKPKKIKPQRRLTIDELIELHLKTGSTRMTGAERILVIKKLKLDIKNLEKKYADADETVDENEVEVKIGQRREQLENFEAIEAQFPGVNFEN